MSEGKQISWQVGIYKLFQYAGGFAFRGRPAKAMIQLMEVGGEHNLFVYFTPDEPSSGIQTIDNKLIAWFAYDQFPAMVDMLRNEKPIYAHMLDSADGRYLSIATTEEPVGEEES